MILFLCLSGRILSSPMINILQKRLTQRGSTPLFIVASSFILLFIVSIPIYYLFQPSTAYYCNPQFWSAVAAMGLCDALGNLYIVKSVKLLDVSVFAPLNAFKPVVALLLGIFILNESATFPGIIGLVIVVAGSLVLNVPNSKLGFRHKGWIFRMMSLFFSALGAVWAKKVILLSTTTVTFFYWILFNGLVSTLIYALRPSSSLSKQISLFRIQVIQFLLLAVTLGGMQWFTMIVFKRMPVGYALSLFQLSSLISVWAGSLWLKEKYLIRRTIAAVIMGIGAAILIQSRT